MIKMWETLWFDGGIICMGNHLMIYAASKYLLSTCTPFKTFNLSYLVDLWFCENCRLIGKVY